MSQYFDVFVTGYTNYAHYMWQTILNPNWHNYFYWLIAISLFFVIIEWTAPWRKTQARFRKDFFLDTFYMFFNFFIFSLIIFNAASDVFVSLFNDALSNIGINNLVALEVYHWPAWAQLLTLFVIRDFIQWWIHRLLHKVDFLWQFHKVHHSVEQMGFAAHLRYHWVENIVYRTLEYIPLAMIGFGIDDFLLVHLFTIIIGHANHSNIKLPLGPLKYIFNNPQMHIWHHAYSLPKKHRYGVNFAITLSIWDYLFKTNYIPSDGRDIKLGFPGIETFPHSFISQASYGFKRAKSSDES